LDIENRPALQKYLWSNFSPAAEFEIREFEVLAGGVSSRTVRVLLAGGQEWVLKQALAKLRVQADWFSDPRRVHREALGMKVLGELTPPGSVPKLVFDDERHHVLAMEAVPRPHENWKTMLLAGRIEDIHFWNFGTLLGTIHLHSWQRRRELEIEFADRAFFESLRLEPYYEYAASQELRAAEFFRNLLVDTRAERSALVHGDFSPKNVLIRHTRLVLLDHEVIHWGDPAFDVGFALTHLLSKALHLSQERPQLAHCANIFAKQYESTFYVPMLAERVVDLRFLQRCVRHTLGCLLARVVGRSPLEYLAPAERTRQREAVVRLIQDLPRDVPELIERFIREIEAYK
jgi:tRNA A-37 threonylcarbamoyl transferase component Bud32